MKKLVSHNRNRIIICFGAPKSGVDLLSDCLYLYYYQTVASPIVRSRVQAINQNIFQYFNHSESMAGPLPRNWLQNKNNQKFKTQIDDLLLTANANDSRKENDSILRSSSHRPNSGILILADPLLCRTMPLWLEVIRERKISYRFFHIIRHPFEVASSIRHDKGFTLAAGHLIWLSYIQDALHYKKGYNYRQICFNQLIADPIFTIESILAKKNSMAKEKQKEIHEALLDHVQPSLKTHHPLRCEETYIEDFKSYANFYYSLKDQEFDNNLFHDSTDCLSRKELIVPAICDHSNGPKSRASIRNIDTKHKTNQHATYPFSLVDSLLRGIGRYEQKEKERKNISKYSSCCNMVSLIGTPNEIGKKWGDMNRDVIIRDMDLTYLKLAAENGISRDSLLKRSDKFVRIVDKIAPHWLSESAAIANAAGVDEDLYISFIDGQARSRFLYETEECTSYTVSKNHLKNSSILFHKTRDNIDRPQMAACLDCSINGINRFICITDGSRIRCSMMANEKGLAAAGDAPPGLLKESPALDLPPAKPRFRGLMAGSILRYIAEYASSSLEALEILERFVKKGYYAGGTQGGNHWLFVDKNGVIIEADNNSEHVVSKVHHQDVYFSRFDKSSAAHALRNAEKVDFHLFHGISRDPSILTYESISGMTVEIDPDYPDLLTCAWITLPVRAPAFPVFIGQNYIPKDLANGKINDLCRKSNIPRKRIEEIERSMHDSKEEIKNKIQIDIETGSQKDVLIKEMEKWSSKKAASLIEELQLEFPVNLDSSSTQLKMNFEFEKQESMKLIKVIIKGKVQNVGYRNFIKTSAILLDVDGWVRNGLDLIIEAVFHGTDENIEKLLSLCQNGPRRAIVEKIEIKKRINPVKKGFIIAKDTEDQTILNEKHPTVN